MTNKYRLVFPFLLVCIIILGIPSVSVSDSYSDKRRYMVENDIRARGVSDQRVLKAMSRVERHLFLEKVYMKYAYEDHPLPIDEGQTISQPYIVALMTEALELKPTDRVLEIGTGSGYQAAILAEIASEVYTIEIREKLAGKSSKLLESLGYRNVMGRHGDGYFGWEEYAPFDAIIITAAANHIPPPLLRQLREGGRLILPLGSTLYFQTLTLIRKMEGELNLEQLGSVAFVPMTGEVRKE